MGYNGGPILNRITHERFLEIAKDNWDSHEDYGGYGYGGCYDDWDSDEDVWLEILQKDDFSYFDLKRFMRVSRGFFMLMESRLFDSILFRGIPEACPPSETLVKLHPLLHLVEDFIYDDISDYQIERLKGVNPHWPKKMQRAPPSESALDGLGSELESGGLEPTFGNFKKETKQHYDPHELSSEAEQDNQAEQDQLVSIHKLACVSQEFATSPPLTSLGVLGIGPWGTIHKKSGITVLDVLEQVEEFWCTSFKNSSQSYFGRLVSFGAENFVWEGWIGPEMGTRGSWIIHGRVRKRETYTPRYRRYTYDCDEETRSSEDSWSS
ncbi:hypothetical protein T439DRAFT_356258 [Meredithblackwellia eburnea MCA 4105]